MIIWGGTRARNFEEWCKNNNNEGWTQFWDYSRNSRLPCEIGTSEKYIAYFKCENNINHYFTRSIPEITKHHYHYSSLCCKSIGSYLESIDDYRCKWSKNNQEISYDIKKKSNKNYLFFCDEHGEYEMKPCNITRGDRCPYCSHHKTTKEESLGEKYPSALKLWSERNQMTPYDYSPFSGSKVWWKCENNLHEDYLRQICNAQYAEFTCPICSFKRHDSRISVKTGEFLEQMFEDVRHEYACTFIPRNPVTNHLLPYDHEVVVLKLIIEVHGAQHYTKGKYNDCSEEKLREIQKRDEYKKEMAIKNGYHYLAIPYWHYNTDKWKEDILNKIDKIKGG